MGSALGPPDLRMVRLTALVVYLGALLVATLGPVRGIPPSFVGADKLVHFGLFGGLVPILYVNLPSASLARRLLLSGTLAVALAAMVELVQIPLPHRSGDSWDLVAGSIGAVFAVVLTPMLLHRLRRRWDTRQSVFLRRRG